MPRTNRFPVSFAWRLEQSQADRLRQVADANGLRPAEWARQVVCAALEVEYERRPVRLRILHAELLRGFLAELQRQGEDLKRISGAAQAGHLDKELAQDLSTLRAQQLRLMTATLDALGAQLAP